MIYLASPYSSPIAGAHELRFEKARAAVIHFLAQGVNVFSPIVYCHEMAARSALRTDAAFWFKFNSDMLRSSEAMFVLCLPGWETSKGVQTEIKQARAILMPLHFFNEKHEQVVEAS